MADSAADGSEAPTGDLRARYEAIRDRLTDEMEGTTCEACGRGGAEGSQLASVAKQLVATLAVLEAIPDPVGSAVDDLAKKRQARRDTAASKRAAGTK